MPLCSASPAAKKERLQAIAIVRVFLEGGFDSEAEGNRKRSELMHLVPDPEVERFLFWGSEGPAEICACHNDC